MKAFPECLNCVLRQAIEIVSRLVKTRRQQLQIIRAVINKINQVDLDRVNPPELTRVAHDVIHRLTGSKDFFREIKISSNEEALLMYPRLKKIVKDSRDPLLMAFRLAIAGNIIDYGALASFDVEAAIKESLRQKFAISDYQQFKKDLTTAKLLLYIGDNAGEIVFDRLLVEQLKPLVSEVVFAVKSRPVLNDVLLADAKQSGMSKLVRVVESGSDFAGTSLRTTTPEFKKLFARADIVIAKGQGNFETLDQEKRNIYFLLKMKCPCLAREIGYKAGDIILKRS